MYSEFVKHSFSLFWICTDLSFGCLRGRPLSIGRDFDGHRTAPSRQSHSNLRISLAFLHRQEQSSSYRVQSQKENHQIVTRRYLRQIRDDDDDDDDIDSDDNVYNEDDRDIDVMTMITYILYLYKLLSLYFIAKFL